MGLEMEMGMGVEMEVEMELDAKRGADGVGAKPVRAICTPRTPGPTQRFQ